MFKFITKVLVVCLIFLFSQPIAPVFSQEITSDNLSLEEQVLRIIRNNPEVIIESVQEYQEKQQYEIQQKRISFLQQLKNNPTLFTQNSPSLGSEDLDVVLIEFSDFQCPYCSQFSGILEEFVEKHQDEVTLFYKHFPLSSIHPEAIPAAEAAIAAQQQGKFWEYHDGLFENQDKLGEKFYLELAKTLNLDEERFNYDRQQAQKLIIQDLKLGEILNIQGTPLLIMGDRLIPGLVDLAKLEEILEEIKK